MDEGVDRLRGLVSLHDLRLETVSPDLVVISSGRPAAASLVTPDVARALDRHCRVFRSLSGHAESIAVGMGATPESAGEILAVLEGLQQLGHFTRASDWLDRLEYSALDQGGEVNAEICIRTCDRPDDLARLLGEIGRNFERFGRTRACTVMDDSTTVAAAARNRQIVEKAGTAGLPVVFLDRQTFGDSLDRAVRSLGLDWELVSGLLLPEGTETYGAALNRVLLWSAGRRVLMLDDDTGLLPLEKGGSTRGSATVSSEPYQYRYLPAGGEMPDFLTAAALDPLAEHERLLGRRMIPEIRQLLQAGNGSVVSDLEPESIEKLNVDGRIRLTASGVLGDSGAGSNLPFFLAPPDSLAPVAESRDRFERAAICHHYWRGGDVTNLTPICRLTATTLWGVDNTELMPPVWPNGRGEDNLFTAVVEYLYPGTFMAELPWALVHAPERRRQYDRRHFKTPHVPDPLQILSELIRRAHVLCRARGGERRLAALSSLLGDYASEEAALDREWTTIVATARASLLLSLKDNLRHHCDSPAWVREEIQRLIATNSDFSSDKLRKGSPGAAGRLLGNYADGLALWPALWRYFRDHGDEMRRTVDTR